MPYYIEKEIVNVSIRGLRHQKRILTNVGYITEKHTNILYIQRRQMTIKRENNFMVTAREKGNTKKHTFLPHYSGSWYT